MIQPKKMLNISDVINIFKDMSDFKENIEIIEKLTMGQSENEHWFEYRKSLASKVQ